MKRSWVLTILLCLATASLRGQTVSRVGTTAAPFLKIGVGARALGMGEAYVTLAEDITAMYWNTAGLSRLQRNQLILNHYEYFADMYFDYGGVAFVLPGFGSVGLAITYFGAPDIERTTLDYQEGNGEMVSVGFYAASVSYARELTDRFAVGFTGKIIREVLWHTQANGVALDVGVIFNTQFHNLKLAAAISNFGTSMRLHGRDLLDQIDIDPRIEGNNENINVYYATDSFPLPILFRVGTSIDLARDVLGISGQSLTVAANAVHPNDNREYVNLGVEYRPHPLLALRAGYRQLFLQDREGGFTAGFGLSHDIGPFGFQLDYAALDYGRLDYVHKFSMILSF